MGTITNITKGFNYTNAPSGSVICISNSSGQFVPETEIVRNFNGQFQVSGSYVGDFNYNEDASGRINMNLNVDSTYYRSANSLVLDSADDIRTQLADPE